MVDVSTWSDAWFRWIVAASWQLALLTAIVAAATWLLRNGSPALRHALWLLVLVKAVAPPSLAAPWSIGTWGVAPAAAELERSGVAWPALAAAPPVGDVVLSSSASANDDLKPPASVADRSNATVNKLLVAWAAGGLLLFGMVVVRYRRLRQSIAQLEAIEEGPLRIEMERLAMPWNRRRLPELYLSAANCSPFLVGTLRPAIVLPQVMETWNADEVRAVLLHELTHWRRCDPWIGWLQAAVQALFWFHPCVWLANRCIRQEREAACDAAALSVGSVAPQRYGETLLKIVGAVQGRSFAAGNLVGVFERGTDLPQRLEAIMSFRNGAQRFGWGSWATLIVATLAFVPMAAATNADEEQTVAEASQADETARGDEASKSQAKRPAVKAEKTPYPQYTSKPAHGATNVDASLKEVVITFDRDMGRGMSITGDPSLLPPIDAATAKPGWRDRRTFVLPVTLAEGAYYRIGVNSKSHQNFQDTFEIPTPPGVIAFTTKGASKELIAKVATPRVVSTEPKIGAKDVDAGLSELKVTFDMPMSNGMSITGDVPAVRGSRPKWSKDMRTITLPIKLEPGREYRFGLNSLQHTNFQSEAGVPLEPVVFEFSTAAEKK